eukprot:7385871-Ditylum_brightwellii.AAC.1
MDILKHWILPEKNLNKGTCYDICVPGNAPELNTLDSNLNCNIHCAVLEYVSYTASLKQPDTQKYSVSTPDCQNSAYLKLWNQELQLILGWKAGVPSSTRILEDMVRITEYSILKQFYACRMVVH